MSFSKISLRSHLRHDTVGLCKFLRVDLVSISCIIVLLSTSIGFAQYPSILANISQKTNQETGVLSVATNNMQQQRQKRHENPWGAFLPGTWVLRRTISQPVVADAAENNVTDMLLTLETDDGPGITLRQETTIEIANAAFTPAPKQMRLDSLMQPMSGEIEIEQLSQQTILVARRQVVCRVSRYTRILGDQKKTTTLWYSDTVMPYLLRSEEIRTNFPPVSGQPEIVLSHTIMTVTETSGLRLLKNLLSEYKTQTIKKTSAGMVISQATHSTNIPGGLVREVIVETDTSNKVIGRSVTSVIDYYVACPGVPVRQHRLYSEASQEIQDRWDSITTPAHEDVESP